MTPLAELAQVRSRRLPMLGAEVDPLTMEETVRLATLSMERRAPLRHMVINVAKLVNMRTDPVLRADVLDSDIINADGAGIVWGARLLGLSVPERVTGIDLMDRLLAVCAQRGFRPFILGTREDVLLQAVERIRARHPGLQFAGVHHGYFGPEREMEVVGQIRDSGADCLFVAMSSPMKERFTGQHREALGVPFVMGVGGSVDVMAGLVQRAPRWMQAAGLEWLFRVLQEPGRLWRRYFVTNLQFLLLLVGALLRRPRVS